MMHYMFIVVFLFQLILLSETLTNYAFSRQHRRAWQELCITVLQAFCLIATFVFYLWYH